MLKIISQKCEKVRAIRNKYISFSFTARYLFLTIVEVLGRLQICYNLSTCTFQLIPPLSYWQSLTPIHPKLSTFIMDGPWWRVLLIPTHIRVLLYIYQNKSQLFVARGVRLHRISNEKCQNDFSEVCLAVENVQWWQNITVFANTFAGICAWVTFWCVLRIPHCFLRWMNLKPELLYSCGSPCSPPVAPPLGFRFRLWSVYL